MTEPVSIRAGDSASWEADVPAYPSASGWQLSYRILSASGAALEFDATASTGTTWSVALTAAQTANLAAGAASLVAYVEKGSGPSLERATLYVLPLLVERDLVAAAVAEFLPEAVVVDQDDIPGTGRAVEVAVAAAQELGGLVGVLRGQVLGVRGAPTLIARPFLRVPPNTSSRPKARKVGSFTSLPCCARPASSLKTPKRRSADDSRSRWPMKSTPPTRKSSTTSSSRSHATSISPASTSSSTGMWSVTSTG